MSHVLSVEDNPLSQAVIADVFCYDDLPAELVCVGSAEEALQILPLLDPLVVLMDLMLPGMSGLDATRIIKSNPATKRLQVWAVTACTARSDIDTALDAGCDGYFTKPIKVKQLVEQLRILADEGIQHFLNQTTGQTNEYHPVG